MRSAIAFVLGDLTLTFFVLGFLVSAAALWFTQQPRTSPIITEMLFSYFVTLLSG